MDEEEGILSWDWARFNKLSKAVTNVFKSTVGSEEGAAAAPTECTKFWDRLLLAIIRE